MNTFTKSHNITCIPRLIISKYQELETVAIDLIQLPLALNGQCYYVKYI